MTDWSVPLAILLAIPVMLLVGVIMERGLIKHFYKRPHADQILVTFGLAIVLQEIIKFFYGANPIQTAPPDVFIGTMDLGVWLGFEANAIAYPYWRMVYFLFSTVIIGGVFAFLQFTTFGMVVRAGMADRETVGLLGIDIDKRFTITFGIAAAVAGLAGVMYTPITPPTYDIGDGTVGPVLRGCGCGRHGFAARRGSGRLLAGNCRELCLDERSEKHPSGHRPNHRLLNGDHCYPSTSARPYGAQRRDGGLRICLV